MQSKLIIPAVLALFSINIISLYVRAQDVTISSLPGTDLESVERSLEKRARELKIEMTIVANDLEIIPDFYPLLEIAIFNPDEYKKPVGSPLSLMNSAVQKQLEILFQDKKSIRISIKKLKNFLKNSGNGEPFFIRTFFTTFPIPLVVPVKKGSKIFLIPSVMGWNDEVKINGETLEKWRAAGGVLSIFTPVGVVPVPMEAVIPWLDITLDYLNDPAKCLENLKSKYNENPILKIENGYLTLSGRKEDKPWRALRIVSEHGKNDFLFDTLGLPVKAIKYKEPDIAENLKNFMEKSRRFDPSRSEIPLSPIVIPTNTSTDIPNFNRQERVGNTALGWEWIRRFLGTSSTLVSIDSALAANLKAHINKLSEIQDLLSKFEPEIEIEDASILARDLPIFVIVPAYMNELPQTEAIPLAGALAVGKEGNPFLPAGHEESGRIYLYTTAGIVELPLKKIKSILYLNEILTRFFHTQRRATRESFEKVWKQITTDIPAITISSHGVAYENSENSTFLILKSPEQWNRADDLIAQEILEKSGVQLSPHISEKPEDTPKPSKNVDIQIILNLYAKIKTYERMISRLRTSPYTSIETMISNTLAEGMKNTSKFSIYRLNDKDSWLVIRRTKDAWIIPDDLTTRPYKIDIERAERMSSNLEEASRHWAAPAIIHSLKEKIRQERNFRRIIP